jgi:hypothetical protein
MNKYLKAFFKMPHSKGSRWECYVCEQMVADGTENKHAMEHVKLVQVRIVSGGGK